VSSLAKIFFKGKIPLHRDLDPADAEFSHESSSRYIDLVITKEGEFWVRSRGVAGDNLEVW
jgi:hypothetical protein